MNNQGSNYEKSKLLSVLNINDYLLIVLIFAGLFLAIFQESIVIKLIGGFLSIIGVIGSYISISQKVAELIKSNKPKVSSPDYKVTVKKDTIGKRKTIEDFDNKNLDIETQVSPQGSNKSKQNNDFEDFTDSTSNEHIRIIKRFSNTPGSSNANTNNNTTTSNIKETKSEIKDNPLFENEINKEIETEKTEVLVSEEFAREEVVTEIETEIEAFDNEAVYTTETLPTPSIIPNNAINTNVNNQAQSQAQVQNTTPIQNIAKSVSQAKLDIKLDDNSINKFATEKTIEKNIDNTHLFSEVEELIENDEDYYSNDTNHANNLFEIPELEYDYKNKNIEQNIINSLQNDILTDEEPRKEFEYFVSRLLLSLRNVTTVNTTAFILHNAERNELILESFVTDLSDLIIDNNKAKMGNDIVSQIIQNQKPEILSEINPSATNDLFFYYTTKTNIHSFIGIPIFYEDKVIGVVTADSVENDAFDNNFASLLGQYSKLISGMLKSYTEKYELSLDSKTLQAVKYFNSLIEKTNIDYNDVNTFLIETVSKVLECNTIGIVVYNADSENWYVNQISSIFEDTSRLLGQNIDINNSLIGQCITENKTVFITPIDSSLVRVNRSEINMQGGFFISIPLKALNQTFGVLYIEGIKASSLSSYEISILQTIANNAGYVVEKIQLLDLIKNNSIYDANTGLLNPNAMYERVYRELERAKATGVHLTLCIIRIDRYASLNPEEHLNRMNIATEQLINLLNSNIREFDILGQIDDDVFAVMLVGVGLEKAQLWAEKIRTEYAMTIIEAEGKRFNATISMGLANSNIVNNVENLIENSAKALNISIEKTNHVQLYS